MNSSETGLHSISEGLGPPIEEASANKPQPTSLEKGQGVVHADLQKEVSAGGPRENCSTILTPGTDETVTCHGGRQTRAAEMKKQRMKTYTNGIAKEIRVADGSMKSGVQMKSLAENSATRNVFSHMTCQLHREGSSKMARASRFEFKIARSKTAMRSR